MKLQDLTNSDDYRVIAIAKKNGDHAALNEASLSRAYKHAKDGHFAIITSWRKHNTKNTNIANLNRLKASIKSLGYSYFDLLGHWKECQDPTIPYSQCPPEQLQDTSEPSLFVVGIDLQNASRLNAEYAQDAFVYSGPETNKQVYLNDGTIKSLGVFSPNQVSQAYSQVRSSGQRHPQNHSFAFEWVAQSQIEVMIEQSFNRQQ